MQSKKGQLWHIGDAQIVANPVFPPHIKLFEILLFPKSKLSLLAGDINRQECVLVVVWGRKKGVSCDCGWFWFECVLEDGDGEAFSYARLEGRKDFWIVSLWYHPPSSSAHGRALSEQEQETCDRRKAGNLPRPSPATRESGERPVKVGSSWWFDDLMTI